VKRYLITVVLAILTTTTAAAQSPRRGWWARLGVGAGEGTKLCDSDAATWICSSHSTGGLVRLYGALGRALTPQLDVGLELTPDRSRLTVNSHNKSTLTSLAVTVVTTVFPLDRTPAFLHVGIGVSGLRLQELNNDHLFVEHRVGWNATAGMGAEFRLSRVLAAGPFVRLDLSEFGAADVFFRHLQQRTLSLGAALTLR
jgi:hypothetical protein